ncbi:MAG: hypothetical protein Q7V05_08860 [Methanoregula sp.]|nr:hypothetical protein [Methanoregula sp.]
MGIFTSGKYTFLCWLLLLTKKLDEAQDPDVMGNETGSAKIFFAATQALPFFFWLVPVPSGNKLRRVQFPAREIFAGDFLEWTIFYGSSASTGKIPVRFSFWAREIF